MKEAIFYEKLRNNSVRCGVCRHRCIIASGKRGYCKTRLNKDGILYTLIYNKVSSWPQLLHGHIRKIRELILPTVVFAFLSQVLLLHDKVF